MISSRPEGLPKSPKPRLSKAESASNIRPHIESTVHVLERKKHFTQGCAGLIVHALLTIYMCMLGTTLITFFLQTGGGIRSQRGGARRRSCPRVAPPAGEIQHETISHQGDTSSASWSNRAGYWQGLYAVLARQADPSRTAGDNLYLMKTTFHPGQLLFGEADQEAVEAMKKEIKRRLTRGAGESAGSSTSSSRRSAGRLHHPQGCEPYPEELLRVFRVSAPDTGELRYQDPRDDAGEAAVRDHGGRRHGFVQTAFPDPEGENTQEGGLQEIQ